MQSFRAPRPTTNPYITMLDQSLREELGDGHRRFDWREALLTRYDVFHWHWPEGKLEGTRWWKAAGKHVLVLALVLKHRLTGVAVTRTVHNVKLPDVPRVSRWLLQLIDRFTDHRIVLNETTVLPISQSRSVIVHADYQQWYARYQASEIVRGRVGAFGAVRRYKSLDALLLAYSGAVTQRPDLSLRIGGRPSTDELRSGIENDVAQLPGAAATLRFITDEELVELVTSCQLVVLAYRFMHNSGSVLAALSLGRPVLVPRNDVNEALADEVGHDWVHVFDGDLDADALLRALAATEDLAPGSMPDLSGRGWKKTGSDHRAAYETAIRRRREAAVAAS
jgi:beta-1,4-mannosyltransferase